MIANKSELGAAEVEVSDPLVLQVAQEIRAITRLAQLQHCVAVGEIVLERIYGGDAARFRSKARKDVSLRKLANYLDAWGTMSRSTLQRCLASYLLIRELPGYAEWRHIGVGHVYALLPLHSDGRTHQVRDLLRRVEGEQWSVKRLRQQVRALRGSAVPTKCARPATELKRELSRVWRMISESPTLADLDHVAAELDADERYELLAQVMEMREWLEALPAKLSPKRGPVERQRRQLQLAPVDPSFGVRRRGSA